MDYDNEIWLPIKGFEGIYEVSNLGRVRSITRKVFRCGVWQTVNGKVLSQKLSKFGYMIVGLHDKAKVKYKYVHRLVGITGRERHDAAIRTPVSCYTLEGELVRHYGSITEAGKDLGVLKTSVWAALSGKSKTCKGMIWKYDR